MKNNKLQLLTLFIKILFTCFWIGSFLVFTYFLSKINIIPTKYLLSGIIGIVLVNFFLFYLLYKKRKFVQILSVFFLCLFSIIFVLGSYYLFKMNSFIVNTKVDYDILSYSVLTLNNDRYNNLMDLKDKNILFLDNEYYEKIKQELNKQITFNEMLKEEFGGLIESLFDGSVDAIVLEESYITIAKDEIEDFFEKVKSIYSFEIQIKAHIEDEENKKELELLTQPFILYISGIDKWGNVDSVRGRSDVNQLVIVNPVTHHILLLNTPRDYYVQLAGTTGLKDKLTHAGIYGIEKSIETLENLYAIDISHYVRVNFNTVVKLVDVIGGIDIYSDKSFQAWTNKKVYVNKGWNHFGGAEALAYARERFAYTTGDHHRGANQQQVITAIFEKMTKSHILISKYNSILNALDKSFTTDLSSEEITSIIKYQLDKMPSWKIESIAVTGSGSMDYTHSMGTKYKLYVMEPDKNSIEKAKQKINEVINER